MGSWVFVDPKSDQFRFRKETFETYDEIAIFVQKRNDLDTICCAGALAKIIKEAFPEKKVGILGLRKTSKFLKNDFEDLINVEINWEKNVLVVLSEICNISEIDKPLIKSIQKGKHIFLLDHHNYEDDNFESIETIKETLKENNVDAFCDKEKTSVCEVLLWLVANRNHNLTIPKRAAELIFTGLYSDTTGLTEANKETISNVHWLCINHDINTQKLIRDQHNKPLTHLRLFARVLDEAYYDKNFVYCSVHVSQVFKYIPGLIKIENGKVKNGKMLTWIPRWLAQQQSDIHTIVFNHFSLFEPYSSDRRYIYVILIKENLALEAVLKNNGFKKVNNRWSREIDTVSMANLIDKYSDLFTA